MKLTGFFANIPLCYIIGFGMSFYYMWLPSERDILPVYYRLTVLIMLGTLVGGAISPLFNVYTVVNKLKWNSIVTLLMGVLNVIVVFIFSGDPGISSVWNLLYCRNLLFLRHHQKHDIYTDVCGALSGAPQTCLLPDDLSLYFCYTSHVSSICRHEPLYYDNKLGHGRCRYSALWYCGLSSEFLPVI